MSMRKIYRKLAKEYGVTVAEVKRDMTVAIEETYKNPTVTALAVPREGDIPTTEEFIEHITDMARVDS